MCVYVYLNKVVLEKYLTTISIIVIGFADSQFNVLTHQCEKIVKKDKNKRKISTKPSIEPYHRLTG